jgi:hypothetical protein
MKRILPILLILAMLLSFAVTAHAEEAPTDTVTLTAPTLCSVQTAVNATDETLHDVRFLATVSDLRGTALGMEIRANFVSGGEQKSVLYNAADGLEGSTVYSSVKETVNGVTKSVTAAELAGDANAKGIFAAIIKGVPSNLTVTFSVTVYVKDGETVVSSPVTMAVDKNGVFAEVTKLDVAGVTKTITPTSKCGGWDVKVVDGKLSVPKHDWHENADYYLTLADANTLKAAKTYLLEMDLTINELAVFCLLLNGDNALSATDRDNNQAGALAIALRQNLGNGWGSGAITKPVVTNYIDFEPKQTEKSIRKEFLNVDAAKATFRLSILVESTEEGCRTTVFANGVYCSSYTFDKAFNVTGNSAIVLWAQNTAMTIDNLRLLTIKN